MPSRDAEGLRGQEHLGPTVCTMTLAKALGLSVSMLKVGNIIYLLGPWRERILFL